MLGKLRNLHDFTGTNSKESERSFSLANSIGHFQKKGRVTLSLTRPKLYYNLWKLLKIKFDTSSNTPSRCIDVIKIV